MYNMQPYAVTDIGHWTLGLVLFFIATHCVNPASGC